MKDILSNIISDIISHHKKPWWEVIQIRELRRSMHYERKGIKKLNKEIKK